MTDEIITFKMFTDKKIREQFLKLNKNLQKKLLCQYVYHKFDWLTDHRDRIDKPWIEQLAFILDEAKSIKCIRKSEYNTLKAVLKMDLKCEDWITDLDKMKITLIGAR